MKPILVLALLCIANVCFAQADTATRYFLKEGKPTSRDSAFSYIKLYPGANGYHGREYYQKGGTLKSEGDYADKEGLTPLGDFNNYTDKGVLDYTASYIDGKPSEIMYYHKNGNKRAYLSFSTGAIDQEKGWDTEGKEIKKYVVMREARFKGGPEGWRKYLEKNLNANIATDAGAPAGEYMVEVRFKVSREGYVSNVKAVAVPTKCKPCGNEAVRAVLNSAEWQPAILHNETIEYMAIQFITFVVIDDRKGKGQ